jgi:hypothetical protein
MVIGINALRKVLLVIILDLKALNDNKGIYFIMV